VELLFNVPLRRSDQMVVNEKLPIGSQERRPVLDVDRLALPPGIVRRRRVGDRQFGTPTRRGGKTNGRRRDTMEKSSAIHLG
jgi:hypothetical protein